MAGLAEQPLWTLDAARARALARDLAGLAAQVAELEARAVAQARDVGEVGEDGVRSLRTCSSTAVMDGPSRTLDLGRRQRFHSSAQRTALTLQQRHGQRGACDVPAAFCHVHHRIPWRAGGRTDLDDAVLLCPFHHHQLHASGATHPTRV